MLETNQTNPIVLESHKSEADEPVKFEDNTDRDEEDGNGEAEGDTWG